jgi:hypothetical protein
MTKHVESNEERLRSFLIGYGSYKLGEDEGEVMGVFAHDIHREAMERVERLGYRIATVAIITPDQEEIESIYVKYMLRIWFAPIKCKSEGM